MSMTEPVLPLVSVVIPTFNRAHYLVPTIESVLRQDYPSIECVVVDGGSTDGTQAILSRYDGRLKWISEADKGPPDAINKGWRMSKGEILAWLNADDLWAEGAVSQAVAYFREHPEVDVVYGDCGIIDSDGRDKKTVSIRNWSLEYAVEYCDHIIYQAASFMRRSILEQVGWLYSRLCHDHELWLRISLAGGRLQHIPALLAYARDHEGNLGSVSDIVVPLKIEMTRGFFSRPDLPIHLSALRERSLSNAYVRGIDYVLGDRLRWHQYWPKIFCLLREALRVDRTNVRRVMSRLLDSALIVFFRMFRCYLPQWFLRAGRALRRRVLGES